MMSETLAMYRQIYVHLSRHGHRTRLILSNPFIGKFLGGLGFPD